MKILMLLCILSKNAVDTAQSKIKSCLKVINCMKERKPQDFTGSCSTCSVTISTCKFARYLQLILDGMS